MLTMRRVLKWAGIAVGGLVGLSALALVVLYAAGSRKIDRRYDAPVTAVAVATDAAALQRGEHLASILLCKNCHGEDLGGKLYFDAPGLVSIPSPNLTAGAGDVGSFYTDADWLRALGHGLGSDGRGPFFMLSPAFRQFGEADMRALIAYLEAVTAVDREMPARQIEPVAPIMMRATGMFPPLASDQIDHAAALPASPAPGLAADNGAILAGTCRECHGANLSGITFGPPGQEVLSPNLTLDGTHPREGYGLIVWAVECSDGLDRLAYLRLHTRLHALGHDVMDQLIRGSIVGDACDDPSVLVKFARPLVPHSVRTYQVQHRTEVATQANCASVCEAGEFASVGDGNGSCSGELQPLLQRVPRFEADRLWLAPACAHRQRIENRARLCERVSYGEREQPGLVLRMQARCGRRDDQARWAGAFNQPRLHPAGSLLHRLIADAPLGQQRPHKVGCELARKAGRLVEDKVTVHQRLGRVRQAALRHT
jgi:hypothetical protein